MDRALGGQQRPTRIQKWVARHPISAGLCLAVPFALFFLMESSEGEVDSLLLGIIPAAGVFGGGVGAVGAAVGSCAVGGAMGYAGMDIISYG